MNEPILLGIDGGGTSTTALLADADGNVLGRGRGGPSNAKAVGEAAARASLSDSISTAFRDAGIAETPADVACLGLAGFDRDEDRKLLAEWGTRWGRRLMLVNDGELVLAAGTPEGWGVAVIAGTGSIAVGKAPDGRSARAGGWGHLIGDEGSAYRVALDGLRFVVERADGRRDRPQGRDGLTDLLCRGLGVDSAEQIVSELYRPAWDRARIAGLAPLVVEASREDAEVFELICDAGCALGEMAVAVATSLQPLSHELPPYPLPIALAGSFLIATEAVRECLIATLRANAHDCRETLVPEPATGALILARRALES